MLHVIVYVCVRKYLCTCLNLYPLIVQKKPTANKGDVFMVGSFWGGGEPKKSRFLAEILQKMRTVLLISLHGVNK